MFMNPKLFYNSSDRYNFSILWFDLHSNVDCLIKIIYDLLSRSIYQIHWIEEYIILNFMMIIGTSRIN